jgi:hypothetical protein
MAPAISQTRLRRSVQRGVVVPDSALQRLVEKSVGVVTDPNEWIELSKYLRAAERVSKAISRKS